MGATHFLTRKLPKVATEMALNVLAYNIKRVMMIVGIAGLLEAMQAQGRLAAPNQRLDEATDCPQDDRRSIPSHQRLGGRGTRRWAQSCTDFTPPWSNSRS